METNSSTTGEDAISPSMQKLDRCPHPRALSEGGVKLFGVRLSTHHNCSMMMMRKAVSMGNLSSYNNISSSPCTNLQIAASEHPECGEGLGSTIDPHGYVSDGLVQNFGSLRERKKGVPWTEEEHRMFLAGLQKLGKGDWRGIARNFVPSRTPTQVASHAQKYFLRLSNLSKRKRRSSLFDMISSSSVSPAGIKSDQAGNLVAELNLASPTSVSAELRLGIPERADQECQLPFQGWCHQFLSQREALNIVGSQVLFIPQSDHLLPLASTLPSPSSFTDINVAQLSVATASFTSSTALSSSSSSSSLSSLGRIDDSLEFSGGLKLSIGPPLLREPFGELTLQLGQPTCEASTNGSSRIANAIRVV